MLPLKKSKSKCRELEKTIFNHSYSFFNSHDRRPQFIIPLVSLKFSQNSSNVEKILESFDKDNANLFQTTYL